MSQQQPSPDWEAFFLLWSYADNMAGILTLLISTAKAALVARIWMGVNLGLAGLANLWLLMILDNNLFFPKEASSRGESVD